MTRNFNKNNLLSTLFHVDIAAAKKCIREIITGKNILSVPYQLHLANNNKDIRECSINSKVPFGSL